MTTSKKPRPRRNLSRPSRNQNPPSVHLPKQTPRLDEVEHRVELLSEAFDRNTSVYSDVLSTLDARTQVCQRVLNDMVRHRVRMTPRHPDVADCLDEFGDMPPHGVEPIAEGAVIDYKYYYEQHWAAVGIINFMQAYKAWQEAHPTVVAEDDDVVVFGGT